eukprot:scaffold36271_cov49-Phaeocystis_antarctica.AAC.5
MATLPTTGARLLLRHLGLHGSRGRPRHQGTPCTPRCRPLASPELGSFASSRGAWRLWAVSALPERGRPTERPATASATAIAASKVTNALVWTLQAGPGTIAEAAIRGLPTMLSSHLPGQEAGTAACESRVAALLTRAALYVQQTRRPA